MWRLNYCKGKEFLWSELTTARGRNFYVAILTTALAGILWSDLTTAMGRFPKHLITHKINTNGISQITKID